MTDHVYVNIDLSQLNHTLTMGMRLLECTVQPVEIKSGAKEAHNFMSIIRKGCSTNTDLTKIEYRTDREIEFQFVNIAANQQPNPFDFKFICHIREFYFGNAPSYTSTCFYRGHHIRLLTLVLVETH